MMSQTTSVPQYKEDNNLTVAFVSAYHYGLNVTSRPDAEHFPSSISDDVSYRVHYPCSATQEIQPKYEYPGVRQYIRKIASDFGWDWVLIISLQAILLRLISRRAQLLSLVVYFLPVSEKLKS